MLDDRKGGMNPAGRQERLSRGRPVHHDLRVVPMLRLHVCAGQVNDVQIGIEGGQPEA